MNTPTGAPVAGSDTTVRATSTTGASHGRRAPILSWLPRTRNFRPLRRRKMARARSFGAAVAEVAEVPDGVPRPHGRVPVGDQRLVMFLDGGERSAERHHPFVEDGAVAEMVVARPQVLDDIGASMGAEARHAAALRRLVGRCAALRVSWYGLLRGSEPCLARMPAQAQGLGIHRAAP